MGSLLSSSLILLAAAALLGLGGVAHAVTVTYSFEGVVSTLIRDGGLFGATGTVQIGDTFTGRILYETGPANPDQLPADPQRGGYVAIELVIDQSVLPTFTPLGILVTHAPGVTTLPPLPPDPGSDGFTLAATSAVIYPSVSLRLLGPFGAAFTDDSLPETLDLADFPDGAFVRGLVALGIQTPNIEDVGTLTSLSRVPEPGSLALLASGLAWLGARRSARAA